MKLGIYLIVIIMITSSSIYAMTINVGIQGGYDYRDHINGPIFGINGALLWGEDLFKIGIGFLKNFEEVNNQFTGYETVTLNFQFEYLYINPFYGYRAIKTTDFFKTNNIYSTKGIFFGYDLMISKDLSLGLMVIYEDPGELDKDKINPRYVKLSSSFTPMIALKFWQ